MFFFFLYPANESILTHSAKCTTHYQVVTSAKKEIWLGQWFVSKAWIKGGWSLLYPLGQKGGVSGRESQELLGSIHILSVAQGKVAIFGFCTWTKSSSVKTRTEVSSQLKPEHPQFSQKLVCGWSDPAFQEWHMSAGGMPGLCPNHSTGLTPHILHFINKLDFWVTGQTLLRQNQDVT